MRTFALVMLAAAAASAQQDFSRVEVKATHVAGNVWMLKGSGGNIGVTVGDDGVAIIDDQFAPLAPKIKAAISGISKKPVKFVINTHWHLDHRGGNAAFADTATIFAHENVRKRMQTGGTGFGMVTEPAEPAALPVVTFEQGLSLWWNGEEIRAIHVNPGHTDGDSVVWFMKSNVVHMGDDFLTVGFPIIDTSSGGSVTGLVKALDSIIPQLPKDAKIIPGHGDVSTVEDLKKWRAAVDEMIGIVRKGLAAHKSIEQLQKEHVLAAWEPTLGGKAKFISAEDFIATIAHDLGAK